MNAMSAVMRILGEQNRKHALDDAADAGEQHRERLCHPGRQKEKKEEPTRSEPDPRMNAFASETRDRLSRCAARQAGYTRTR